jgi:hypothetical protein
MKSVKIAAKRMTTGIVALTIGTGGIPARAEAAAPAADAPLPPDPAIVAILEGLRPGQSAMLPRPKVETGGRELFNNQHERGPGRRDFCNKMLYAPERRAALYAGGNHGAGGNANDVWEYSLEANTWRLLAGPDGGDLRMIRPTNYHTGTPMKWINLDRARALWDEVIDIRDDGQIVTRPSGGPVAPSHTWDTFAYDTKNRCFIWWGASGDIRGFGNVLRILKGMSNEGIAKLSAGRDYVHQPTWLFWPGTREWRQLKREPDAVWPDRMTMGAAFCYIPDWEKVLYYSHLGGTWSYDIAAHQWERLKVKGFNPQASGPASRNWTAEQWRRFTSPGSELVAAYAPKHGKVLAVRGSCTFAFDIRDLAWSRVSFTQGFDVGDHCSTLGYSEKGDYFLAASERGDIALAAFSFAAGDWQAIKPDGPAVPRRNIRGYFDPARDVFVVQSRGEVWVYRHR